MAAIPEIFGWRWGDNVADVNAQTYLAAQDTPIVVPLSALSATVYYLHIGVHNVGDASQTASLRLGSADVGNILTAATDPVESATVADGVLEGDNTVITADDLTGGTGSFANGEFDGAGGNVIETDIANGTYTDICFAVRFTSANTGGETIDFDVRSGGTPITDNTGGITATIESASSSGTPPGGGYWFT